MCDHRPQCPAIDQSGAETARVLIHHADLGWSLLCNGAVVLDGSVPLRPPAWVVPPRASRTRRRAPRVATPTANAQPVAA